MSRLLETIRCQDGRLQNLRFHQARMDASVQSLFLTTNRTVLEELPVPQGFRDGLFKCRITYTDSLESVEFLPYELPVIRAVKVVTADAIDYSYKFADRTALQGLLNKRGDCDEILIVKNGLVTDTSFSNLLFFDGQQWLTPALPLLRGTRREMLLARKAIVAAHIRPGELSRFEKIRVINSMIRFEDQCDAGAIVTGTKTRTVGQ